MGSRRTAPSGGRTGCPLPGGSQHHHQGPAPPCRRWPDRDRAELGHLPCPQLTPQLRVKRLTAQRRWLELLAVASQVAAARDAIGVACASDVRDAAHGARQPAVVELQGAGKVGTLAGVRVMPGGGQRGQFPDGVDVAGPAVPELVTGVVLAQHGIGPVPQFGQLGQVCLAVQAEPGGGGGLPQ